MILQRITDWLRERRIKRLGYAAKVAFLDGHKALARLHFDAMAAEIELRSPGQVQRMERRLWKRINGEGTH